MRRSRIAMVGVLLVAAAFAGCGGDSGAAPGSGFIDEGSNAVPFKSTDLTPLADMQAQMKEKAKSGAYKQRPTPPKDKADKAK